MCLDGFDNVNEEVVGRRVDQSVGIPMSGIAGQIIKAFQRDVISGTETRDKLGELFQAGRINRKIYEELLAVLSKA
jgi:predicted nucleic acid-binding protein